jgi:hypothetical protein
MSDELYLILHRVRGEPAFDIAQKMSDMSRDEDWWIIPTSGHRAYPYRWWILEDLADVTDINNEGFHDRPATFDHTVPADWPDHYRQRAKPNPNPGQKWNRTILIELGLEHLLNEESQT